VSNTPLDLPHDRLVGRVAVITGASRGLGAGLAERFAEHGLALGLCARHEPTPPPGARALTGSVDVTDPASVLRFAHAVTASLGPIDLWVNNAGVLDPMGPLRDLDTDAIGKAVDINIGGVIHGSQAFVVAARAAAMPALAGRRLLVNITSGAATSVYEGWSIYGAGKAAVDQFTRVLAAEEPDIAVHAVAPGLIDTDMQAIIRTHRESTFPSVARFQQAHEQGTMNSPAWVADHLLALLAGTWTPDDVVVRIPDEPS
jgi:benzil reductase ((S)-benzoin forming)